MNYQIICHIVVTYMLGIVLVTSTQGNSIPKYKETCQNEKYDGGRLNCFEGYCSSMINGGTEPDHKYNSNCKTFCPKCYKAWSTYNASLWQNGKADPGTPPTTDPRKDSTSTSTSSSPTIDPRPDPTGPSGGNSSAWDQVWPALIVIAIVAIVAIVIGIYFWKKRAGFTRPTSNQPTGIGQYTPVPTERRIEGARNSAGNALDMLEGPPTQQSIPNGTGPQSMPNGTVPKASVTPSLMPNGTGPQTGTETLTGATPSLMPNGTGQQTGTETLTGATPSLMPNGTGQQTGTETLTGATPSLTPNGTGPPTGDNPLEGVTPQLTHNGIGPQTGTEPQTGATPPLTPNGTGPQTGNIPEMSAGQQLGAAPQPAPNGVPRMGANSPPPQVVTNSNSTGGNANTTQQSAGAGASLQSTMIGTVHNFNFYGTVPTSSEPAPTTTALPQEQLSTAVQEKGKGAELETTQEVRDDVGGPHKFSPPD